MGARSGVGGIWTWILTLAVMASLTLSACRWQYRLNEAGTRGFMDAHLAKVEKGDLTGAYADYTPEFRRHMDPDAFQSAFHGQLERVWGRLAAARFCFYRPGPEMRADGRSYPSALLYYRADMIGAPPPPAGEPPSHTYVLANLVLRKHRLYVLGYRYIRLPDAGLPAEFR